MIKGVFRIMLIVAVSIFSMIQAASFMLGFPHSPEPIFMIGKLPLHGATAVQTWERAGLLHGDVERFAYSIGLLVAGSLVFVWLKNRQYSMRQSERASWGTAHDARRAKLLSRRGVVLGKIGWRTIRDNSDAHIGIMAPPGAGKSTTIAIPTLLGGWRQAVIVHDPKGELWSKTSAWRRQHVGPVLRFDLTDQHTVRYNPLTEIRWNTSHKMGDAQALARALVPIGSSTDSYFENLALQFLTALILFVGDTQKDPSLAQIRELAESFEDALPLIAKSGHPEGVQLAEKLANADPKMRTIFESEILAHVWQFADPIIARATSGSDFRAGDLMCEARPLTLYLCVPARHQHRVAPIYRVILQSILGALSEREKEDLQGRAKKHRLLALIDEFPSLGRMDPIRTSMPIVRSYGIKIALFAQSTKQLAEIYGTQNSFLDMLSIIWITAGADPSSLAAYSQMLGDTRDYRRSISPEGRVSHGEHSRQRLTPGAIRELDMREALLLRQGARPLKVRKLRPWVWWSIYRNRHGEAYAKVTSDNRRIQEALAS